MSIPRTNNSIFALRFYLWFSPQYNIFCPAYHSSKFYLFNGVQQKLDKEISHGRIAGPFTHIPLDNFVCSPLSLVPKKTPGEYRLIHNLSFPPGASVNTAIPEQHSKVQYARVSDFIDRLKTLEPGAWMAK
jgi:hypothetical protein